MSPKANKISSIKKAKKKKKKQEQLLVINFP